MLAFHADSMDDVGDTLTYTATVDHDISRMENLLDQWTTELKKNVMVLVNSYIYIYIYICMYIYMAWLFLHFNISHLKLFQYAVLIFIAMGIVV